MVDLVGTPTYTGILLAILAANTSFREFTSSHTLLRRLVVPILFITGWFFLSIPSIGPELTPWFRFLAVDLAGIFPAGANIFRQSIYIGIPMILVSILLSSTLQKQLCRPPLLWLGELSL
jgi:hypothetical protein